MQQSLQDRLDITDLVYRYAQSIDDRDLETLLGCFAIDAQVTYNGGAIVLNGLEELRQFYVKQLSDEGIGARHPSLHMMANVLVEVTGDRARAETSAVVYLTNREGIVTTRGLHYSDACIKVAGEWVLQHRAHRALFQMELPGQSFPFPARP